MNDEEIRNGFMQVGSSGSTDFITTTGNAVLEMSPNVYCPSIEYGFEYAFPNNLRQFKNLPEHYVINKKVVMLQWSKEDKTVIKLSEGDDFNVRLGFLIAYFQHTSGLSKSKANKYLDELKETPINSKRLEAKKNKKLIASLEEV